MPAEKKNLSRRRFLAGAVATVAAAVPVASSRAKNSNQRGLQVWSCGGLAEAFIRANQTFEKKNGVNVVYTGAFAGALGKSLLGGATTEIFAGRVVGLSQKLRKAAKMDYFKPLCFTRYVMVTPKGNPAGISEIKDIAKPGIKVILAKQASPPGGQAVDGLLKKAGILEPVVENTVLSGSCVQRTMEALVTGKGDVSIVEFRLTRLPQFRGNAEVLSIPSKYFPAPPLSFTIGVMNNAADKVLAGEYVDFICSEKGQSYFQWAGFIPALSAKGQQLIKKLGVHDV